jgi:three-Cys-motif partner protein
MVKKRSLKFDKIGNWSEIKLEIIDAYAKEYSTIISAQKKIRLHHVYIDAFAGSGEHVSKTNLKVVAGSPIKALAVSPSFKEYFFIDLDDLKIEHLRKLSGERKDVHILHGDCNDVLKRDVFPHVRWDQYKRGLCLLDPYGLHLDWKVIKTAGSMKSIEIFLNFPVADMNRNVIWHHPVGVSDEDIARMNTFWGDESWKTIAYTTTKNLFGYKEKEPNIVIAEGFRQRLKNIAGFEYVPEPLAMRNKNNAIIYYLFFAAHKPVSKTIVDYIFRKYGKSK